MPYPLVGGNVTATNGVTISVSPDDVDIAVAITPTRTWGLVVGGNMIWGQQRSTAGLTISAEPDEPTLAVSIAVQRRWGGIGTTVVDVSDGWHLIS